VVLRVILPVLALLIIFNYPLFVLFSISISTTSPSTISDSSFILTPIDLLKA